MAATIIIYAGAIVVTFLFVLMLAQQAGHSDADARSREPLLAGLTGFVLLGALLYVCSSVSCRHSRSIRGCRPVPEPHPLGEDKKTAAASRKRCRDELLNEALERSGPSRRGTEELNRLAALVLAEELNNDHSFLSQAALEMLGHKGLADLTENDHRTVDDWPPDNAPDWTPASCKTC